MLEERGLLTGKEGRGLKVAQLGAAAIAVVMLSMSFALLLAINLLQARLSHRAGGLR